MNGCTKKYSKLICTSQEKIRMTHNMRQPAEQKNYTELGFMKAQAPSVIFETLKYFYHKNKANRKPENWEGKGYTFTNHWKSPTYAVQVDDESHEGGGLNLKIKVWKAVQSMIEEWTGQELVVTSVYGIREYTRGSILAPHIDRLPLVSSCVINIAQSGMNEPWPLEVYDHTGKAHNVTLEPGEMILYEASPMSNISCDLIITNICIYLCVHVIL
jgi:hypothetical protein